LAEDELIKTFLTLFVIFALGTQLVSCGGDSGSSSTSSCAETGPYACQTGATEPLYTYQWALNAAQSFFASYTLVSDGTTDLNVDAVHKQGIKGQGVNVLVLDNGVEINHEDLKDNVNPSMTWNFQNNNSDPTPSGSSPDAHGTNAAGIIAAVQNGIGVMGIAPRVTLGAAGDARILNTAQEYAAFGGAPWSINAHVINFSIGRNPIPPLSYTDAIAVGGQPWTNLRSNKGLIVVQSAGNEYIKFRQRDCRKVNNTTQIVSCENPVNETDLLNPMRLSIAAANAKGYRASYSSAGSINWVTGLGGEYSSTGNYGEVGSAANEEGPQIYSTDLMGCERGYSQNGLSADNTVQFMIGGSPINMEKNPNCNFDQMNGTSASAPTITGVVALMLSANPNLSWRDVRHILATTSKQMDPDYGSRDGRNKQINLVDYTFTDSTSTALTDGASATRVDYGWQTNAAGYKYSNWYGFGLADATAAVAKAKATTTYMSAALTLPAFIPVPAMENKSFTYGQVTKLGEFTVTGADKVDGMQLRLNAGTKDAGTSDDQDSDDSSSTASDLCIGSVGIYVQSPSGTVSILAVPYNIYYNTDTQLTTTNDYGLGTYAFYGEAAAGSWQVFTVSGKPKETCTTAGTSSISVEYRIIPMP
jgi:subtilisin family serine protease